MFRGIFEWGLLYKESEIPEDEKRQRKQISEPFKSPTHAGGLFAIERKWFERLGFYDPGLQIWVSEIDDFDINTAQLRLDRFFSGG